MMSYTMNELLTLLKERYDPIEIVEILELDSKILVNSLICHIENNYDAVHCKIIEDEMNHFGVCFGEDTE